VNIRHELLKSGAVISMEGTHTALLVNNVRHISDFGLLYIKEAYFEKAVIFQLGTGIKLPQLSYFYYKGEGEVSEFMSKSLLNRGVANLYE
jgi:hypothetical protein